MEGISKRLGIDCELSSSDLQTGIQLKRLNKQIVSSYKLHQWEEFDKALQEVEALNTDRFKDSYYYEDCLRFGIASYA